MPTQINGLPSHVLLVHAVVVLVPVTALVITLAAVWPRARRWIGPGAPVLALATLVLVPVTTRAGRWLQARVADTPLIRQHAQLGGTLLPFAAGMLVVSATGWLVYRWWDRADARRAATGEPPGRAVARRVVAIVLAAVTAAVAGASVVQVYRVGDSGAKAVWTGNVHTTPHPLPRTGR